MKNVLPFFLIFLSFTSNFIFSCKTNNLTNNEMDANFIGNDEYVPKVIVDEGGLIDVSNEKGIVKENLSKVLLCNIGDYYLLEPDKPYKFEFQGFNAKNSTIVTEVREDGKILLKVVDLNDLQLKLTLKCQTHIIYSTSLPNIIANPPSKEQIVITPLFKEGCVHYAYEVRLGSTESGCNDKSVRINLKKRKECSGNQKVPKRNKLKKNSDIFDPNS